MRSGCAICIGLLTLGRLASAQVTDAGRFFPVEPVVTVGHGTIQVQVGQTGEMQIETGVDSYIVESCFSYPRVEIRRPDGSVDWNSCKIGWNGFPRSFNNHDNYPDVTRQLGNEPSWTPAVTKPSADTLTVEAEGRCYRLVRTVKVSDGRIDIDDQFTNKREHPTAIVPRHRVTAQQDFLERFVPYGLEMPANPAIFLPGPKSSLGLVMQDNISRHRFRFQFPEKGNRGGFQINRVVLDKGVTRTLSWSVYVMGESQKYFDFINRVRRDWNANFTIDGPFVFGYLRPEGDDIKFYLISSPRVFYVNQVLKDPAEMHKLAEYLQWRGAKMLAIAPWLDYDPGAFNHVVSREEYKQLMPRFIKVIKQANPLIKCIGLIETDWVTVPRSKINAGDKLPQPGVGDIVPAGGGIVSEKLTVEHVKIIEEGMSAWKDSFVRGADGKLMLEYYRRGGAWVDPALCVFPQVGNHQYDFMMGQVKFLLDEIGMDGVYLDEFPLGQNGFRRTYGGPWDGMSADQSFTTGEWNAPYKDCGLAGTQARVNVMNHVLAKGKIFIANRHSTTRAEQSIPAFRFTECGGAAAESAAACQPGEKPPLAKYLLFGALNTPIGLGIGPSPSSEDPVRWVMRGLIVYLRHGALFNYGDSGPPEPPPTEGGQGAIRCIRKMYPITPLELGEGFIIGRERILTAVSMNRLWAKDGKPTVSIFDIRGLDVAPTDRCQIKPENGQWRLVLKLKDWAEVAVVE